MKVSIVDVLALGSALRERSKAIPIPEPVQHPLAAFLKLHSRYEACQAAVELADEARQNKMEQLARDDEGLEGALENVGVALVAAKLGPRTNPFKSFTRLSESKIRDLAYAKEIDEVRAIATKVTMAAPPPEVSRELASLLDAAATMETHLRELSIPKALFDERVREREDAFVEWSAAFARLKVRARAEWADQPRTFEAFFAPPEAVQRPVSKRKPKKDSPKTPEKVPA